MATIELLTKQLERDEDVNRKNIADWDKEIAMELSKQEGIEELTDRHWIVIDFMRSVYEEKGDAPSIRKLTKESGVDTKELYALFPKGPAKKAAKIAGLPKPKGCI
ncbi:MAG: sulfur relay protein DsrC [Ignavibacteriae bacterium]|nr:MAG: sulfur relay protein DsrC [Ignavibacteriota bacterium]